jgi:hypothetical protein
MVHAACFASIDFALATFEHRWLTAQRLAARIQTLTTADNSAGMMFAWPESEGCDDFLAA